jgi:hypothetical protein
MGIIVFLAGLLTVLGTAGFVESEYTISNVNSIAIFIQFAGGFFLMFIGTELLQENNG